MAKGEYLGEFELVVMLALARLGGEGYGMSIHDEILQITKREVSIPAVYVTLTRLQKKGYASSHLGERTSERGGRAKKFYCIEPDGAAALRRSREMLDRLWDGVRLEVIR
ncbi:MAG: PadR family transcriptional regulator [Gemmatimonadales bacterium]|jgi:PadR family transcriptional regulator PadR